VYKIYVAIIVRAQKNLFENPLSENNNYRKARATVESSSNSDLLYFVTGCTTVDLLTNVRSKPKTRNPAEAGFLASIATT
jgi:hypothetical protein